MAYTNVTVSDSGSSYSGYNHDTINKEIPRNRVIGGDEHAFNTIELGEKTKNVISNASGSNGNKSFKLDIAILISVLIASGNASITSDFLLLNLSISISLFFIFF